MPELLKNKDMIKDLGLEKINMTNDSIVIIVEESLSEDPNKMEDEKK